MFDTVGDGKIECTESGDVIRSLEFNPASEDIKKVVQDVDPRGECSHTTESIRTTTYNILLMITFYYHKQ